MRVSTEDEREHMAQVLASTTVPWLTYAVHTRNRQMVADVLTDLDRQELMALAVVLAARCPRPLMRPDDGEVDEIAVARACSGEPVPLSARERLEAVRVLMARGRGVGEISELLNVSGNTARRLMDKVNEEKEVA
jgi:hypothetical protein